MERIINKIQYIRWSILPACCYNEDEDEDEKSVTDYEIFYRDRIDECLVAVGDYINTLDQLSRRNDAEHYHILFDTRKRFIDLFPFCYDELDDFSDSGMNDVKN